MWTRRCLRDGNNNGKNFRFDQYLVVEHGCKLSVFKIEAISDLPAIKTGCEYGENEVVGNTPMSFYDIAVMLAMCHRLHPFMCASMLLAVGRGMGIATKQRPVLLAFAWT